MSRYVEGVDYWVYGVDFPNMASPSVAVSNGDGTFTIYINTRCSPERRAEGLRHELEHLEGEHFYRDDRELCELEDAANGLLALAPLESDAHDGVRYIPVYNSPGEFLEHFLRHASPESLKKLREASLLPHGKGDAAH